MKFKIGILLVFLLPISILAIDKNDLKNNDSLDIDSLKTLSTLRDAQNIVLINTELLAEKNKIYIWDTKDDKICIYNIITGVLIKELKLNDMVKYYYHKKNDDIWKSLEPKTTIHGIFKDEINNKIFLNAITRKGKYEKINETDSTLIGFQTSLMIDISNDSLGKIYEKNIYPYYLIGSDAILFDGDIISEFSATKDINQQDRLILVDKNWNVVRTFLNLNKLEKLLNMKIDPHRVGFFAGNSIDNLYYYSFPDIPPMKLNVFSDEITLINPQGKLKEVKNLPFINKNLNYKSNYYFAGMAIMDSVLIIEVDKKYENNSRSIIEDIYLQFYDNKLNYIKEIKISNNNKNQKIFDVEILGKYYDKLLFLINIDNNRQLRYYEINRL